MHNETADKLTALQSGERAFYVRRMEASKVMVDAIALVSSLKHFLLHFFLAKHVDTYSMYLYMAKMANTKKKPYLQRENLANHKMKRRPNNKIKRLKRTPIDESANKTKKKIGKKC